MLTTAFFLFNQKQSQNLYRRGEVSQASNNISCSYTLRSNLSFLKIILLQAVLSKKKNRVCVPFFYWVSQRSPIKGTDRMTGKKVYGINSPGERTSEKQRWVDKGIQLPASPTLIGFGSCFYRFSFQERSSSHRRWHLTSAATMAEKKQSPGFLES